MKVKKSLKLFLACFCTTAMLFTGCADKTGVPASTEAQNQTPEAAFDQLSQDIFRNYAGSDTLTLSFTLKDPPAFGIQMDEVTWGEISITDEDLEADKAELQSYLDRLNEITGLKDERAVDYDVLKYSLEADLEGFNYIFQPNNLSPLIGFQSQLPINLAEYHFDDKTDVEDYLALLNSLGGYVDQILAFENKKVENGYGMCKAAVQASIEECQNYIENPETNLLIEVFPDNLTELTDLSEEEKNAYIEKNKDAVLNSVIPAYQKIIDSLTAQLDTAPENGSLASYENGLEYYKYLLKSSVGTDKTPEELIEMTESQMGDSLFAMAMIMSKNPQVLDDAAAAEYSMSDPAEIVEHFKSTFTAEQMPEPPEVSYTLKNVHESMSENLSPAMYFIPRIDDISNNQIYLNLNENYANALMPTLAHEGYPGHMYQYTYYLNTHPNPIRKACECLGYVEGWASYVENMSYSYCGFSEDLAEVLRLNNSTFALNLYCRLDLGIHYEGWSLEKTKEFLKTYLDLDDETLQTIYEDVLFNPTNYMVYGIGMDEIQELKTNARDNLGESFDIKEFHREFLDLGPAPFPVIRKYMPETSVQETTDETK